MMMKYQMIVELILEVMMMMSLMKMKNIDNTGGG
jgi:hypothetical protein